jgi:hypothetical protein
MEGMVLSFYFSEFAGGILSVAMNFAELQEQQFDSAGRRRSGTSFATRSVAGTIQLKLI